MWSNAHYFFAFSLRRIFYGWREIFKKHSSRYVLWSCHFIPCMYRTCKTQVHDFQIFSFFIRIKRYFLHNESKRSATMFDYLFSDYALGVPKGADLRGKVSVILARERWRSFLKIWSPGLGLRDGGWGLGVLSGVGWGVPSNGSPSGLSPLAMGLVWSDCGILSFPIP